MVSLDAYRAQRRRVVSVPDRRAQRMAWNLMVAAVLAMAFITTAAALHHEQRLQQMEVGR